MATPDPLIADRAVVAAALEGDRADIRRSGEETGLTERWAAFAADLTYDQLPAALLPVLKGLLLDTVGVSLAATTLSPCALQVMGLARAQSSAPESAALGYGEGLSRLMAGLVNGTLAHALNFDAVGQRGGHIGVATVPAPLAMAQALGGISGKQLLVALALAAEFTTRLAASIDNIGIDVHAMFLEGQILGVFGAAVGAGKVLGFDAATMQNLLGLALMQSSGTRQISIEGGAAKAMAGGFANHAGLLAALLAEQGLDAQCAALEGRAGLYALFYEGHYRQSAMVNGLGQDFLSMQTVFKRWPMSGILTPFITASLDARQHSLAKMSDITRIHITAGEAVRAWLEPEDIRRRPTNGASAANSIMFGVSRALVNGDVTLADFSSEGLDEPRANALAQAMTFAIDPALGRDAIVNVTLSDGTGYTASAGAHQALVSFDDLAAKFRSCAQHNVRPIANSAVEVFIENVEALEKVSDICDLLGLLRH